ncbi:MAG: phospholipid carrier-dependent glycosyltransferase, partial [Candidatus Moranbacteria bacterium]|nr:phospholipid carrier-dependent glycosyltransferase [Candidatus Moranbacteria bacterium]
LLGPRAGATQVDSGFLRLGPAYYYFQYISGKIFNSTEPQVFAYPDLFFSMGAIVLLYFFSRLYFSRKVSLAITTLYAFSFIIIEYSRFAWNPNSLQFFLLLTFFALLKFLNEEKMKAKLGWVALWALALAIGSQLHFFGFFVLLGVSGLFIVLRSKFWKKEKLQEFVTTDFWKKMAMYGVTFAAVFTFFYTPVIISDVMRKGENASNFVQALSSKPSSKPFIEKISKNFSENTKYYCLISTSFCNVGGLDDNALPAIFTVILLISGLVLAVRAMRKEQSAIKRDFLMVVFIWMGVFFILTTPVAFDLRPRFFILVFAIPFILTGIIFNFLLEKFPKKAIYFISAIFAIILGLNIFGTSAWFAEQKNSQIDDVEIDRTLILKTKDGVTLGQLQRAVDFMYAKRKNKDATIYFYVKPEHVQPIRYILEQKKDPTLKFATLNEQANDDPAAQFFAIIPSQTDLASLEKKYSNNIESLSAEKVGQITVYEINFLSRQTSNDFRLNKEFKKTDRVFWKDVFGLKANTVEEATDEIDMNE